MAFMIRHWQSHIFQVSLAIFFFCQPGILYAQGSPTGLTESTSLLLAIIKVIGSLAVVIALMITFIYLLKKTGMSKGHGNNSLIKVLDNKMIAPKKYITIVEIAGKTVSLGITDHTISLLTELEPSAVSSLPSAAGVSSFSNLPQQFAGFLSKAARQNRLRGEKDDR